MEMKPEMFLVETLPVSMRTKNLACADRHLPGLADRGAERGQQPGIGANLHISGDTYCSMSGGRLTMRRPMVLRLRSTVARGQDAAGEVSRRRGARRPAIPGRAAHARSSANSLKLLHRLAVER